MLYNSCQSLPTSQRLDKKLPGYTLLPPVIVVKASVIVVHAVLNICVPAMYSGVGVVCIEAIVNICVEAIVNIGVVAVGRPMLRIVMVVGVVRMMVARPKVPPILAGDFVGIFQSLDQSQAC